MPPPHARHSAAVARRLNEGTTPVPPAEPCPQHPPDWSVIPTTLTRQYMGADPFPRSSGHPDDYRGDTTLERDEVTDVPIALMATTWNR